MIKKLLYSLGIITATASSLNAQITIVQWDVAGIPKQLRVANDTNPTVNPGPAGANLTWNFSALATNAPGADTMYFTNPYWTPYQTNFPTANLAIQQGLNGHNGTIYTNISAASFNILGQHASIANIALNVIFNPDETLITFPSTYNTTFNDNSAFDVKAPFNQFPIDSVRLKELKTKTSKIDAWGNITTPLVSNMPCIRQRVGARVIDSIWVHDVISSGWSLYQNTDDTTITFSWWASGQGFPLVQMDSVSTAPYVQNGQWLSVAPVNSVEKYNSVMNTSAYPNPAVNVINIDVTGSNASFIHVMDISGREIAKFNVNNDIEAIAIDQFAAGAYLFSVTSNTGEMIGRGKFNVIK